MIQVIITFISGFLSIITLLIKNKIDERKSTKEVKTLIESIKETDEKQNEDITLINNNLKLVKDDLRKQSFDINKFFSNQQLTDKIIEKNLDLQFNLSKTIIDNLQETRENRALQIASQKIIDFKTIVKDYNNFINGENK